MRIGRILLCIAVFAGMMGSRGLANTRDDADWQRIESQFRTLPMESRRLTGPLFWLHGQESKELLEAYVDKVAEGGNGSFTPESRPHIDWLGPGWYRDLGILLEKAREHDLEMWIFDEKWWPSGMVGGMVPEEYASKVLDASAVSVDGPKSFVQEHLGDKLVAVIAGRVSEQGIEGDSLIDLTDQVQDGVLRWDAPAGQWSVMVFTWKLAEKHWMGCYLVDGASQAAADWLVQTVYQPHYDHFKEDFGKTIVGYFYDEPETLGDWGTEVIPMLRERGVDWKKALVAKKFKLAVADDQLAAAYQYRDALAEAWGKTLFGSMTDWCHAHGVKSIGHFLEHEYCYYHKHYCAGNMFQLQKYSSMGGIDAVFAQFVAGQRNMGLWQTPKLGSSISHAYGKEDDIAMVEIFGARGQDLTYPEMKWWTDHMHVSGINFHIPHSFNPKSPLDGDCPPYFYNNGYEPRWPLYRVYADYTSRLSEILTGGRHVCPVAFLYMGQSVHFGQTLTPEVMSTALQDALFDCDWLPYDVFDQDVRIEDRGLALREERYQVLVMPAVEVIPCETLAKVRDFYEAGGVVVGYGILPQRSATLGKGSEDIAALRQAIWGDSPSMGLKVCRKNDAGGRSYFLPAEPTPEQIEQVLTGDAGIYPSLDVISGDTGDWLHVLHRVKAGRDVFMLTNQNYDGLARDFILRIHAWGEPEVWDPMRNELCSIDYLRLDGPLIHMPITLESNESVLLVFNRTRRDLPGRIGSSEVEQVGEVAVERQPTPEKPVQPLLKAAAEQKAATEGLQWVWYPEGDGAMAPPGRRYFRKKIELPTDRAIKRASLMVTADNYLEVYVDGSWIHNGNEWAQLYNLELSSWLAGGGAHQLAIAAENRTDQPSPAGLIGRLMVTFDDGSIMAVDIDESWKTSKEESPSWKALDFDDSGWAQTQVVASYGDQPWGKIGHQFMTRSPVEEDLFIGKFVIPADVDLDKVRVYLEADRIEPEGAAHVTVNGQYAGGFIGKPYRLNIGGQIKAGDNTVELKPFAPETVKIVFYQE